jgi:hypothetical protein
VDAHGERDRGPARCQLLQRLQVDLVRLTAAAVLLRVGKPEQSDLANGADELARELFAVLELGGVRCELVVRQLRDELQQLA